MTDFEEFSSQRKTIKENVERLLEKFPETRNDYRLLIQYYHYYVDGLKSFIPLEKLRGLTQPESITRAFREIVNVERKAQPPKQAVQEARQIQEQHYEEYYGRKKRERNDFWD